ncbi:MAG: GEVED domain-containing protein, partial [Bacteroidota bacterium]
MKKLSFFIFVSIVLASKVYSQYCTPSFTNICTTALAADYVHNFSTTGGDVNISNLNTGCSGNAGNYIYYSTLKTAALPGTTINLSVSNQANTWSDGFAIWVDWNQDQAFDATELVWNSGVTGNGTVFTGFFVVPNNAKPGITRMRVLDRFNVIPSTPDVCATGMDYGECEDYNFEVLSAAPPPQFIVPPIANYAYDEGIDTVWVN